MTAEHGGIGHDSPNPGIAGVYYDNTAGGNVVSGRSIYLSLGDVAGKLPVSKGGLGTSFAANRNGILIKDSATDFYLGPIDISTHTQNTLGVSHGGTGKTSFDSNRVLITGGSGSNITTLQLTDKKVFGGNRSGNPDNMTIENGSAGHGLILTSNEAADHSSVSINFSLQQNLSANSNVTFNALALTGLSDSTGFKYLKKDGYLKSSEINLGTDVNGVLPVSKGGLGIGSLSAGLLHAKTSSSVGTSDLASVSEFPKVIFGTDEDEIAPATLAFGTGLSVNTNDDGNGNISVIFALDRDTETANGITAVSTPTFGGLYLGDSDLFNAKLLKYTGSGTFMQKYNDTLPVSKGGTGISSIPASGKYLVTTNGSSNWQAVNQFESLKVFMGNSSSTAMEAVRLTGGYGIVVSTKAGEGTTTVKVGLPQDLSEGASDVHFANVNIGGDVVASTLKAGVLIVPVEDNCKFDDSGTPGEMKFCKTRYKYSCTGISPKLCYKNGNFFCRSTDLGLCSTDAVGGTPGNVSTSFNHLVYYRDGAWRCASNDLKIGLTGGDACANNYNDGEQTL